MPASAARALDWVEQGLVPDRVIRLGIRRLLRARLAEVQAEDVEATAAATQAFVQTLREAPLAVLPEKANEQHYEVPAEFFGSVLGPHRKYSCCWWGDGVADLGAAEQAALEATCERAGLGNDQDILELGCGWGSLSLWMASQLPGARIWALSNSLSQRRFIEAEARRRGLRNLQVITADFNEFDTPHRFHRVVSVEMFEHLRNWPRAFSRVAGWLRPEGRFFLHVFSHRAAPYLFEERDHSDWMSRHFFSGGMMPSDDLALHFQDELRQVNRWRWNGIHYQKTAEAWLRHLDERPAAAMRALRETHGAEAELWRMRWRLFFLSVSELFGHDAGRQWFVSHYLFDRRA